MNLRWSKPDLLETLTRGGLIGRADAARLAEEARRDRLPQCVVLARARLVEERRLVNHLAEKLALPVMALDALRPDESALALLPAPLAGRTDFLPLQQYGKVLAVAMADPCDRETIEALERATRLQVRATIAPLSALAEVHRRLTAIASLERHAEAPEQNLLRRLVPFFERLEDYRFEGVLGEGGFGVVCRCWQHSLERQVAVKVLNPEWNRIEQIARRFQREGQIIARLDHPNIIRVHEQGERDGVCYIVMEYFEGEPLNLHLRGKDWGRTLSVLIQVCAAAQYAHERGVIHRDLKPANILVNRLGAIKLLDFGIAHQETNATELTLPQLVLGTPKYMAPEVKQGADRAAPASDIFAFGVIALEILTGQTWREEEKRHPSEIAPRIPRFLGDALLQSVSPHAERRPESFLRLGMLLQRAVDEIIFGEAAAGRERRLGESGTRQTRLSALERLFQFKAVLRNDRQVRTIHAHNTQMGRDVVVKLIEASSLAAPLHPYADLREQHIGELYGLGRQGELVLLVGEWMEGGSLAAALGRPREPADVVDLLEGVIRALAQAEKQGLAHGRLHPGNIMLAASGAAKVVDFGMAQPEAHEAWPQYFLKLRGATPAEQDRHALGALAWELMVGEAYSGTSRYGLAWEQVNTSPVVHPLLKYFLARLWNVKEQHPPYESYEAMLLDVARIRNRLSRQADWTAVGDPALARTLAG